MWVMWLHDWLDGELSGIERTGIWGRADVVSCVRRGAVRCGAGVGWGWGSKGVAVHAAKNNRSLHNNPCVTRVRDCMQASPSGAAFPLRAPNPSRRRRPHLAVRTAPMCRSMVTTRNPSASMGGQLICCAV